ncbi:hypothetical protein BU16DRAFT_565257 [Lophium mytilinum]|uniref:RING-type domain-containing protein n=1 Tax=Lophium mytilinum TaxID=390894 RepID=A0A6A6QHP1_9PEZI|nr:hypothetical protein BU16DRAFT_565257 [Lophium mytilinum]
MPSLGASRPSTHSEFAANHLTALEINNPEPHECNICYEKLGAEHPAVQITGIEGCHHIFGRDCLVTWTKSFNFNHNKCPMCRITLFGRGNRLDPNGLSDLELMGHDIALWNLQRANLRLGPPSLGPRPSRHPSRTVRRAGGLFNMGEVSQLDGSGPTTGAASLDDISARMAQLRQRWQQTRSTANEQQPGEFAARLERTTTMPARSQPIGGPRAEALTRLDDEQQATAGASQEAEQDQPNAFPQRARLLRDFAAGREQIDSLLRKLEEQDAQRSRDQLQSSADTSTGPSVLQAPIGTRRRLVPRPGAPPGPRRLDLMQHRARAAAVREMAIENRNAARAMMEARSERGVPAWLPRDADVQSESARSHAQLRQELTDLETGIRKEKDQQRALENQLKESQQRLAGVQQEAANVRQRMAEAWRSEQESERQKQLQRGEPRRGEGLTPGGIASRLAELEATSQNVVVRSMSTQRQYLHAQMGDSLTLERGGMPSNQFGQLHFQAYQHQRRDEEEWRSRQ